MSNLPVDRDPNYMREMWGTARLVTDYGNTPPKRVIQEVMHDAARAHHALGDASEMIESALPLAARHCDCWLD